MKDLENLYKQVIFDHYKNPRNKGLKGYDKVHLRNPSCGDDVTVEIKLNGDVIEEINHSGSGCSICCSSASVLSETLKGKTVEEAKQLILDFYNMMIGHEANEELEEAVVYQGVSQFPARIKCATLSWKALEKLLNGEKDEE